LNTSTILKLVNNKI